VARDATVHSGRTTRSAPNDRIEQILTVAVAVFAQQGYRATSMNDLAVAAGISKPGLYHYFTSKEQLLVLLYESVLAQHAAEERDVLAAGMTATESLRAILIKRIVFSCEQQRLQRIFTEEEAEVPDELMGVIRQQRRDREDYLVQLIESGVRAGEFRLDTSPRIAVRAMVGAANFCYKWYDPAGRKTPGEIGQDVSTFLMGSLAISLP
jgi:AcrR family transcriptional regulator